MFSIRPHRECVWYMFVNSKQIEHHSDHHQSSGANKKDTYRHTTGGEQHDPVSPADTECTDTLAERSAGGKQHVPGFALTCVVLC